MSTPVPLTVQNAPVFAVLSAAMLVGSMTTSAYPRLVALAARGLSMMMAGSGPLPLGSRSVALNDALRPFACTVTVSVLPLRVPVTLVGAGGRCPYS